MQRYGRLLLMSNPHQSTGLMPTQVTTVSLSSDGQMMCGARKKNGDACKLLAGFGTTHHGYGPCKYHMGNMREVANRAAKDAIRDVAQYRAQLGEISPDADPEEVIMQEVARAHRAVDAFDDLVNQLDEETLVSQKGRTLVSMWNKQRELLAAVARIALQAGIAERQTQVLEIQAMAVIQAFAATLSDPTLDLSVQQQHKARRLLAAQLRQIVMSDDQRQQMFQAETA